ncbi:MAG TPA: 4-hydroxy-tetrahydrodipicolinate reductase [Chitinophagaceae bacterium]|nr:4-hydroxy-tetrahydrodipicolinate reductase [Chitinophagaceae bacterium]
MNIALIGYGKMGKAIEEIALQRGHQIILKIDVSNASDFTRENMSRADVAIEFTGPDSAFNNVMSCIEWKIPVVVGSTGWLHRYEEVREACVRQRSAMLYASNFSVGVNIFFALNERLASLMAEHEEYKISLNEIHHTQKKDAPSGTAITLAEAVLAANPHKKKWVNHISTVPEELEIISERIDPTPGTHTVSYHSGIDSIEIKHTAHNRKGFAGGAVLAAEFLQGKTGVFSMRDVLNL